ncbi:UDP-N-acetylenolpyruvoylglucosamine reductase [Candidatus Berkelbacteria bacterium CG10_big_fil_rev_8_21_14_0_10_43_14]|uniref:UDP-N-acetylenolpyruvoylglucosamine reductase n=1 Tax=Candidatus Berkelbacteria bacterium CG10_big_fil_rev_8_21_14_0_10_43_14 TaxID=1974515 RepID=A0A2M6R936_9BACT|nr:MAG: UDP-N-acetylenolpyruvoylglucosamine reductase [Candidatus Berkelbacteria bacterium CG10_big_fil_rev_8_21_14_0_10_43_14]
MNIIENKPLAKHTTFKVGGPTKYFCVVKTIDEIKEALAFATEKNIDYFILAGGSNVIVSDDGYNGLVIKPEFHNISIHNDSITIGSGFVLDKLVDLANSKGLKGLDWAGGLPGTVGGAVRGNAGAFGGEIRNCVSEVRSMKYVLRENKIVARNNQECEFGYRTSIFKHNKEIILEVDLQMEKGEPKLLKEKSTFTRQYRSEKHPIEFPCAGSIFKNIPTKILTSNVRKRFEGVIKTDPFPVIPIAAIIDQAGLKGYKIGNAQISEKHPNYIINLGHAKAQDIVDIIEYTVKTIKNKYNIDLEVEPQLLGFDKKYEWESN